MCDIVVVLIHLGVIALEESVGCGRFGSVVECWWLERVGHVFLLVFCCKELSFGFGLGGAFDVCWVVCG